MIAQTKIIQATVFSSLPSGFQLRSDGIWRAVQKGQEDTEWIWLCSHLQVLSTTRDRDSKGWGRLVELIDPDGNIHRLALAARMLAVDGAELRAQLLDLGLDLARGKPAHDALLDLLTRWQPSVRTTAADRLGWTDETCTAFTLGDGQVIGADNVIYQNDNSPAAAAEMKSMGALDGWRDAVAAPCSGNVLMIAAASLAFASSLLEPLGMDGGGIHLRGASSRGKSTIQRVAVSVWGSPGFLHSWRATANGLEGVATACNGSVLALDELGEISGREAGQAAYMLANGTGKSRASRLGIARPVARWRVMVLSSGEITLADKVAEAGGRAAAGQSVRLLDIAADGRVYGAFDDLHDSPDGAAFADRLRSATAMHYGTAGPTFVTAYLRDAEAAKRKVRETINDFRDLAAGRFNASADGQVKRAASRLGLVAAAGELATAFGITGWAKGAANDAALEVFRLWLEGRGGSGPSEARDAIERVRAFLMAHGEARFERIQNGESDRIIMDKAGWCDEETFYISTDTWREIHTGSDSKRAARHLFEAGFLHSGDGANLAVRMNRGVSGRPRAYAVSVDILGSDDG